MDDRIADQFTENGYTVKIVWDEDPMTPRDADNLGVLFAPHRNYNLGDEGYVDLSDYKRAADYFYERATSRAAFHRMMHLYLKTYHGATKVLPVALIDHSGLSMWVGSEPSPSDPSGWDSGQVGWIFDTAATREMTGCPLDRIEECLRSEVEEYDKYLTGDAYGYIIEDSEGDTVDSCWGYLGSEYAEESAREAANALPELTADRALHAKRDALLKQIESVDSRRAALLTELATVEAQLTPSEV